MLVRCPDCDRPYDDARRWTICPHRNLGESPKETPMPQPAGNQGDMIQPPPKSQAADSPIEPTVGRTVLFTPHQANGKCQPYPALITHVFSRNCVNLSVGQDGSYPLQDTKPTSVMFSPDGKAPGSWTWMEFQKGQAAKLDTLTPRIAHIEQHLTNSGAFMPAS